MSIDKFINDVNWLDTIGLHCLITLAGMLSNPEAFFIFILSIFLFNSIRCYRLEFKIFLHIHMIFNFHYTRVSSGVIYLILVFTIYMIFYAITLCFIMFICPFVGPLIWTNKILSYLILSYTVSSPISSATVEKKVLNFSETSHVSFIILLSSHRIIF